MPRGTPMSEQLAEPENGTPVENKALGAQLKPELLRGAGTLAT